MAFFEDYSVYFNDSEHAVKAAFTPRSGTGSCVITGILEKGYSQVETGGEVGVAALQPSFITLSASLKNPRGGTLTINNERYLITDVEPDGTGVTTLLLDYAS